MKNLFFLIILSLVFIACSRTKEIGHREMVDESGSRENWVERDDLSWEEDENLYFKGILTDAAKIEVALRQGKAELVKSISEKISITVNSELSSAFAGTNLKKNEVDQFIEDVINWTTENLQISGITPAKSYWQKFEVTEPYGVSYNYDAYMLGFISMQDYNYAYQKALENLEKTDNDYARNVAKKLIDEFKARNK